MRKPNKRRPDRTHYRAAGVSIVGPHKGVRRYVMHRGKVSTRYVPGLGPHHGLRVAVASTEGTPR